MLKASSELVALSLSDLPKIQLCKFVEQSVTLLSVIYQVTDCPVPEIIAQFRQIHGHIDLTLDFMERTLEAQSNFPDYPSPADIWF